MARLFTVWSMTATHTPTAPETIPEIWSIRDIADFCQRSIRQANRIVRDATFPRPIRGDKHRWTASTVVAFAVASMITENFHTSRRTFIRADCPTLTAVSSAPIETICATWHRLRPGGGRHSPHLLPARLLAVTHMAQPEHTWISDLLTGWSAGGVDADGVE